jgi:hypothetical protein
MYLDGIVMEDDIVQISFAGSGGMYHYYLGVAKILQDNFHLDNVIFGGTSGGCFPALLLVLGKDIDKVHYEVNRQILEEAADSWMGSLFRWNAITRKYITEFLDDDTHEKVNGRLHLSMTKVRPWGNEVVSEWETTEDLIQCIQCSSFIPLIFEFKVWNWHRDARYIDGGVTNNKVHVHLDKPHIYITTTMWREVSYNWIWCYTDLMWAEQLYKWGKEDATDHLQEFAEHLRVKDTSLLNRLNEAIVLTDDEEDISKIL